MNPAPPELCPRFWQEGFLTCKLKVSEGTCAFGTVAPANGGILNSGGAG